MSEKNLEKISVAQLSFSQGIGGTEICMQRWHKEFSELGVRGHVICHKGSPLHDTCNKLKIKYLALNPKKAYFDFSIMRIIRAYVIKNNIGCMLINSPKDASSLSCALAGLNIKIHCCIHAMPFKNKKDFFHRFVYSRINNVIHFSMAQKGEILRFLPFKEEQLWFLPHGVDLGRFKKQEDNGIRVQLGIKSDDILVGHVGRFVPEKGQLEVVQAALEIIKGHKNVHFLFIGMQEGDIMAQFKAKLVELASVYSSNIHFMDFFEDIHRAYQSFDIFCFLNTRH